ncbi:MAG: signal peptide peptidase SppA [Bacteroidaceae bacterium]|nr:signal peptide peptidase SppA [Bacteroidaceae bacterium]
MKEFLKYTLATVVGIVLVSVLCTLLGLVSLFGIVAASEQEVPVKPNSIFTLTFDAAVEERAVPNPFAAVMGEEAEAIGLDDVLGSIKKAKENENICGIYLETGNFPGAEPATLEAIRRALVDFKESGKFIVAYGDMYTQGEYYLCSVADKVILNPQGAVAWTGLSAQPVFLKGLFDKLGVKMQIFKVGTYKSAVEPFVNTSMSEANREQTSAYLHSIWGQIIADVAASRSISADSLNAYADLMMATGPAEEFVRCGMVDTLLYMDGVKSYLKQLTGTDEDDALNTLALSDMINVKRNVPKDKSGNVVAVYYAVGEITDQPAQAMPGGEEGIVGGKVITDLSRLREDDDVKAVVLRVNSPGGSAFASEQIWNEVVKLKAKKPVIVSMGGMAASGGYYISCAADSIFAEPTTLTGSIGIFGMMPDMQGLLTDKLGLAFDVVNTNRYSDLGNATRPMTEGEKQLIQASVERGYGLFVKRCADGRGVSEEQIRQVAEGRVWTGAMAQERGLVDCLGGIDDAIAAAANKAGVENYTVLAYPAQASFFDNLLSQGKDNYINAKLRTSAGEYYGIIRCLNSLKEMTPLQARIEADPNIRL